MLIEFTCQARTIKNRTAVVEVDVNAVNGCGVHLRSVKFVEREVHF